MKRKLLAAIICVSVLVSTFAITSFAEIWGDYCIPLAGASDEEMYYEAGIGTNIIRAETGVTGRAGVHNVYVGLIARDSSHNLIRELADETTDYKYIEVTVTYPSALSIVKHIRTAHMVYLGSQLVGHEDVHKKCDNGVWTECNC